MHRFLNALRQRAHPASAPLAFLLTVCVFCVAQAGRAGDSPGERTPARSVVEDDRGRLVPVTPRARRIISLAPHLTELVHTAGAGARLVAVSEHCNHPPEVADLPRVSDYRSVNYELLAQLKPDLVLVWEAGLRDHALAKLEALGPRVYVSDPRDFEAVADTLKALGRLAGHGESARKEAEHFIGEINKLKDDYKNNPRLNVLYLIHTPPPFTVNRHHWITRLLNACGARNPFADSPADVVKINAEQLLLKPPDIVVHSMSQTPNLGVPLDAPFFYVPGDLVQRPTTRLLSGAQKLCDIIGAQAATSRP